MIALKEKASNRACINQEITKFYNGLIKDINFIIWGDKPGDIKPINPNNPFNFKDISNFISKTYSKFEKQINALINQSIEKFGSKNTILTEDEKMLMINNCEDLINNFSDNFQPAFCKKISSLMKEDPTSIDNFKQATYNFLTQKINENFNSKNLPKSYCITQIIYFENEK